MVLTSCWSHCRRLRGVNSLTRARRGDVTDDRAATFLAAQFEEHRHAPARRRLPDARVGQRGRRRRAGGLAAAEPRPTPATIENLGGWLTTVVARVCLNMLRSREARREESLDDVHVPDPIVSRESGLDPEHEALLADSVGLALLVVLETLDAGRAAGVRAARHVRACRSTRSRRWSTAHRPRRGSSRAARGGASAAPPRRRTPTCAASARSSTPSSRPRATATSRRSSAVLDPDVVLRARRRRAARRAQRSRCTAPRPSRRSAMTFARPGAVRPAGAGQRRRRRRRHAEGPPVLGHGLHRRRRPDRRDRRPRRPGPPGASST